jgi:two-component system, NarL family, response regulator LiaR
MVTKETGKRAPIKILLADDHRLFRQGLRQICEVIGGFLIIGEAENGREAVQLALELEPEVVLMDIHMPEVNGIQATQQILRQRPNLHILILTMYRQDHYAFDAINAGAKGYLLKNADAQEVVDAIRAVCRGEALVDREMAAKVLDEFRRLSHPSATVQKSEPLTDGEMEVLRLVANGATNQLIAGRLSLSPQTVANRLRVIYQKLEVDNRTEAALYALRRGWASLVDEG